MNMAEQEIVCTQRLMDTADGEQRKTKECCPTILNIRNLDDKQ